jgi:tellurite resistance protein TerC
MLGLDLGVINRKAHTVSIREALIFTLALAVLALLFNAFVWFAYDHHWLGLGGTVDRLDGQLNTGRLAAVKFFTAYLIELSLSADNVFVMAMIFTHLKIPPKYQHRVLFWGILGALVMRGAMILVGTSLIARYHWILYVFGLFLIYTAVRMYRTHHEEELEADEALIVRLLRKVVPISERVDEAHLTTRVDGRLMLTPLAVALALIETMDLLFALDSIPATFAVTADPFLVFTSNVFAILGLRSLYFMLAGAIRKFRYLNVSLAAILGLVGLKMVLSDVLADVLGPNFSLYLLGVVALILAVGILASRVAERRDAARAAARPDALSLNPPSSEARES